MIFSEFNAENQLFFRFAEPFFSHIAYKFVLCIVKSA